MQHTLFPQADGPLGPSIKVCPAMPPTQTDSPCSPAEFEEPRVIDLWDLAQSANFTEKELESFRVRKLGGKAVSPSVGVSNGIGFSVPFPHHTMRSCFCPDPFPSHPGLCSPCHPGRQSCGSRWAHTSHANSLSASCVQHGGMVYPALCWEVLRGAYGHGVWPECALGVELQEADGGIYLLNRVVESYLLFRVG